MPVIGNDFNFPPLDDKSRPDMAIPPPRDDQRYFVYEDGGSGVRSGDELADLTTDRAVDNSTASLTVNEQELVTIRPAMPSQSSHTPFPSKVPRMVGHTPESYRGLGGGLSGFDRLTGGHVSLTAQTTPAQPTAKTEPASDDHEPVRRSEEEGDKLSEWLRKMRKPGRARTSYKIGEHRTHGSDDYPVRIIKRHDVKGKIVGWDVEFVEHRQTMWPTVALTIRRETIHWPEQSTFGDLSRVCRTLSALPSSSEADSPAGLISIESIEQPGKRHTVVVGWGVHHDRTTETVLVSELQHRHEFVGYSTVWDILAVARAKRGDMTPMGAESFHREIGEGVDHHVLFWAFCDAGKIFHDEWKAKRRARKLTGLTARKVARLDQTLFGYSTVSGFSEWAAQISSEFPRLGWSLETCCDRLWKLLREEDQRQPHLFSPAILDCAMELLKARRPPKKVAPPRVRRLRRTSVSETQPVPSLNFDLNRIDQIGAITAQVDAFLGEELRDEDELSSLKQDVVESSPTTVEVSQDERSFELADLTVKPIADARFVGLAARFVPFVEQISMQPKWSRVELDRLARELKMMLDGAVDAVNEWADERFGDLLLIDEGDGFQIQGELLIDNTGPT